MRTIWREKKTLRETKPAITSPETDRKSDSAQKSELFVARTEPNRKPKVTVFRGKFLLHFVALRATNM